MPAARHPHAGSTPRRWLITGGCGFIGSHFIRLLLRERAAAVANLDALTYAGRPENIADCAAHRRYQFWRADVADPAAVEAAFAQFRPELVVHFAAESHVDRSIGDAAAFLRTNVQGTQVLLDATRRHRVHRFVLVSTDEVYGDIAPPLRAREDAPLAPNSPYAASKAAAELLLRAAARTHGLDTVLTRGSNTYGPNQFPEKLIPLAISQALARQPVPLYGDGQQVRNWLSVADHCRGILAAAENGRPGAVYNLGSTEECSNLSLLEQLLQVLDCPRSLIQPVTDRPGHDRRYALDSSRARSELDWSPQMELTLGLRQTIEWYRQHPQWLAAVRNPDFDAYYRRQYGSPLAPPSAQP